MKIKEVKNIEFQPVGIAFLFDEVFSQPSLYEKKYKNAPPPVHGAGSWQIGGKSSMQPIDLESIKPLLWN